MNVTMNDFNFDSLVKRCEEKEEAGYEYITPIIPVGQTGNKYNQGYGGQWKFGEVLVSSKYRVVMRKIAQ